MTLVVRRDNDYIKIEPMDITCDYCGAVVRVVAIAYGVLDEKKWFDCPECHRALFSWEGARVYDIEKVLKRGNSDLPSQHSN